MRDLSSAKHMLLEGGYTCVLCRGDRFFTATSRGVKPLVDWLDGGLDLQGFSAADKVVGRATAFLYCLLRVKEVHALVMSSPAKEALESAGIQATCDREVSGIINRKGDGPCPFENAVLGISDAQEALTAIRKKQFQMRFPESIHALVGERDFHLDRFGLSGATIAIFKDMVLKCEQQSENSRNEIAMLHWLSGKVPVPKVLKSELIQGHRWTLMTRLPGTMSCAAHFRRDPWKLTECLARGLQLLWSVDCTDCPVDQCLDTKLARLEADGASLTMDESVPRDIFPTPNDLLDWLRTHKPKEKAVLIHGDYCLPNIFLDHRQLTGFLDLGRSGVGDPWTDIAICWRSLRDNFGGHYGPSIPGFHPDYLFEVLQIQKDTSKLQYYLNLDELF